MLSHVTVSIMRIVTLLKVPMDPSCGCHSPSGHVRWLLPHPHDRKVLKRGGRVPVLFRQDEMTMQRVYSKAAESEMGAEDERTKQRG